MSESTGHRVANHGLDGTADVRDIGLREAQRRNPARLAAVHATNLLDTEVEEVFDRLTRLAVRLLHIPAAFISLVDAERDFYKSACGFGEPLASSRELTGVTFCHYTVLRTTPLVIPDTAADPVYRDVPTVRTLGVAAYVGVPLIVGGQAVGALCAIDMHPRAWSSEEVEVLVELAASAQREMELRGAIATTQLSLEAIERQRAELESTNAQLQEQTLELEMQTEELHTATTRLEERTEEAEAANRSKGKFLSMMSHELRTPLNAIGGYAELVSLGIDGPVTSVQQDYLGRIRRAATHLQTLIGDILEFARLDAAQIRYEIQDTRANDLISEAVELVAPQLSERGIVFTYDAASKEAEAAGRRLRADAGRVRQILVNLLANAIKFTPEGGAVSVSCEYAAERVTIAISDTGKGIPPSQLSNIFEPFVQIDRSATTGRHQGVGLGLAIGRELARAMRGDLTVTSELDVGSTFVLTLPAGSINP